MQTLKEYIESEIIPRYDNFDGAHRRDHVRSVIGQSQELSRYYDVNPEILYAAAAYIQGSEDNAYSPCDANRADTSLWFRHQH